MGVRWIMKQETLNRACWLSDTIAEFRKKIQILNEVMQDKSENFKISPNSPHYELLTFDSDFSIETAKKQLEKWKDI